MYRVDVFYDLINHSLFGDLSCLQLCTVKKQFSSKYFYASTLFGLFSSEPSPGGTFLVEGMKPRQTRLPTQYPFFLISSTSDSVQGSSVKTASPDSLHLVLAFASMRNRQQPGASDCWENDCLLLSEGRILRLGGWKPPLTLVEQMDRTLAIEDTVEMGHQPWTLSLGNGNISR